MTVTGMRYSYSYLSRSAVVQVSEGWVSVSVGGNDWRLSRTATAGLLPRPVNDLLLLVELTASASVADLGCCETGDSWPASNPVQSPSTELLVAFSVALRWLSVTVAVLDKLAASSPPTLAFTGSASRSSSDCCCTMKTLVAGTAEGIETPHRWSVVTAVWSPSAAVAECSSVTCAVLDAAAGLTAKHDTSRCSSDAAATGCELRLLLRALLLSFLMSESQSACVLRGCSRLPQTQWQHTFCMHYSECIEKERQVQGARWSWKVMEFRKTIFQAWKVMENSNGHGKSWKSHGKWW